MTNMISKWWIITRNGEKELKWPTISIKRALDKLGRLKRTRSRCQLASKTVLDKLKRSQLASK
uniref:Uncharacterized protein n=1 Tax=Microplitis mediator bracovirus TaxID=1836595 RepID=A0A2I6SGX9_9VIRU|nr:hypothetical protein MmBV_CRP1 [Microplitis mediator bracovirus]